MTSADAGKPLSQETRKPRLIARLTRPANSVHRNGYRATCCSCPPQCQPERDIACCSCSTTVLNGPLEPPQRPATSGGSRRSRTPRPGPVRCAAGSGQRRVSQRSPCGRARRRTAGAVPSRGRFGRVWPGAGERFGRICLARGVVAAHRFPAHAGFGLDPSVAPTELEQRENLRFLRHLQVVSHRHPQGGEPSRMPEHPYLQWPVFRRSIVAAFHERPGT